MRRLVVTPTFAAGLGVVVAAVLAYPMKTVFSYVAPGAAGRGGLGCTHSGCAQQPGPGKPSPFGAGGGALSPSSPGPAEPGNDGPPASPGLPPASPGLQTGGSGGGDTRIAQPRLSYKITSEWQGGFWGQITIKFPGAVPAKWRLRIGYPAGHILSMNPGSALAPNGHAVVVRSTDYPGGPGPGRRTFAVGVGVQGVPAHPGRCSFNGRACHID
jgi:hypothetical protein